MAYRTEHYKASQKIRKSRPGNKIHSFAKIAWDAAMTVIAVVNLAMIVFDLTYLQVRTFYLNYLPELTTIYDPVKGVEPEPRTEKAISCAMRIGVMEANTRTAYLAARECEEQFWELLEQGAFSASGRDSAFADVLRIMNEQSGLKTGERDLNAAKNIMGVYWQYAARNPKEHLIVFQDKVKPKMETNFRRKTNFSGNYIDDFYKIDAPFLIFFALEFLVRWVLSVKRREYIAWFLFPLYNWYDILGLLPISQLRIFRLVRLYRIYREFRENSLGIEGDDFIASIIKKYSGIIAEEISDMVAVKILSEAQDEVKRGATVKVVTDSLQPRKNELKTAVKNYIQKSLENQDQNTQVRSLLEKSLEDSARRVPSLTLVPDLIKVRLTREIGLSVYDAMLDAMRRHFRTENSLSDRMIDEIIANMVDRDPDSPVSDLSETITLDFLENLKAIVSRKKWATPDMQHFPMSQDHSDLNRKSTESTDD